MTQHLTGGVVEWPGDVCHHHLDATIGVGDPLQISDYHAAVAVAATINWPVAEARARQIVGRFAEIEYTPVEHLDPTIVLSFDSGRHFNAAMARFQRVRMWGHLRADLWFRHAKVAGALVLEALKPLAPCPVESAFVSDWLTRIVVSMDVIPALPEPPRRRGTVRERIEAATPDLEKGQWF